MGNYPLIGDEMAKEREYGKYVALSSWDAQVNTTGNCGSGDGYNTIEEALEAAWLERDRDQVLDMLIKVCYALNELDHERFKEIYYNGGN